MHICIHKCNYYQLKLRSWSFPAPRRLLSSLLMSLCLSCSLCPKYFPPSKHMAHSLGPSSLCLNVKFSVRPDHPVWNYNTSHILYLPSLLFLPLTPPNGLYDVHVCIYTHIYINVKSAAPHWSSIRAEILTILTLLCHNTCMSGT